MHYQLLEIWREVLGVQEIGIKDDFFALGGNSLLALRMLTRVEQVCGQSLLPAALFKQATIEYLGNELLTRGGKQAPMVLKLQEGGTRSPFFYLHGDITGGGYYTIRLSRGLGAEQPFYALPPVDVEKVGGLPEIEQMAAMHVEAIRSVRPHGPYALGGFCIGGLVAYEVAQQLRAAGEKVERLIIIDMSVENRLLKWLRRRAETVGARRKLDDNGRLHLFTQWHLLWARSERWLGLGFKQQAAIFRKRLLNQVRRLLPKKAPPPVDADPAAWYDPQWDTPLVFLWATGGYHAKPYPGKVTLLLSRDLAEGKGKNPTEDWRKYAPDLHTRNLEGAHLASITEHVETLTAAVRESLA